MQDAGDITVSARVSGGRDGDGGGGGGAGIILEQGGGLTIDNNAAVAGGDGGNHGDGGAGVLLQAAGTVTVASGTVTGGAGNARGSGGAAIASTASGTTIFNAGTLEGGAGGGSSTGGWSGAAGGAGSGGAPGFVPLTPLQGRGSVGILGAAGGGIVIVNSGHIEGGTSFYGQANAISLFGDNNRLELWFGSTITGNVVVAGGGANNTLALGGAADSSFDVSQVGAAAQYQGFDRFEKTGSSTWTLSGTSTEAAPWTVNGGTLVVNGSIAASTLTTVNAGGVLGGNGTVGNTLIDGGVLSPGNSIGALTVAGNLVLTAASTYMVEVDPTSADFTHVTGTATLGGATVQAHFAPGSYVEKRYTILTADGGVNGVFAGPVNTNLPTNFKSALAYDGTNAFLDLTLSLRQGELNFNQRNVAETLTNFFDATGGIPLAFGALDPRGLSQATGEVATGASQAAFDAQSQFLNAMTDPFAAGRGAASSATPAMSYAGAPRDAYAALFTKAAPPVVPFEQRWRVFGAAYGGSAQISGNAALGSHDATARVYGGLGGAAYALSPATQLGFALGGGGTAFGLSDGLGSGRSDLFQAGVFARHNFAHSGYLTGAFAYGWHDVTTERVAPTGERLRGAYKSTVLSGRVETGWRIDTVYAGVTPYAAAQALSYRLPSYLEQGNGAADSFALGYTGRDVAATRSELGLRFDRTMALGDALVTLRGRAAWATISTPNARSPPLSRRCPAPASSSTARRRRVMPRSSPPGPKSAGRTACRSPQPSRASFQTQLRAMPERASSDTRGKRLTATENRPPCEDRFRATSNSFRTT